jgi:hypothetical protein
MHLCGAVATTAKDRFNAFVVENAERLLMDATYPKKTEVLHEWMKSCIRGTSDSKIHNFAQTFAANLQHISFTEFRNQIFKVCQELRRRIEKARQPVVALLLGDGWRKSGTWVTALAWHALSDLVHIVAKHPDELPEEFWTAAAPIIIHADDMTYSGAQLVSYITAYYQQLVESRRLLYLLMVPYVGSSARQHLQINVPRVQIPESAVSVPNIQELLEFSGYNSEKVLQRLEDEPWASLYDVHPEQSLIYFDHKLADSASVPSKLIALPSVSDENDEITIFKVISNCEDAVYRNYSGELVRWDSWVSDFAPDSTCPIAFYKQIRYTWQGQALNADAKLPLLDLLQ